MVVSYWLTIARKYLHARTAALLVLGPSSGWFLAATARMSRASSSGDRLGSVSSEVHASATSGVIAIHQKSICQAGTGSPVLGPSVLLCARCVLCTVLRVGTRTWESVCDQQRRHLQRKGDFARGATCVELVTLLEFLGSVFSHLRSDPRTNIYLARFTSG